MLYTDTKRYGWICPKCHKVHAPWVASCDCHKRPEGMNWTEVKLRYGLEDEPEDTSLRTVSSSDLTKPTIS